MSKTYVKHRLHSFQRQGGRCHYCNAPMWLSHPEAFTTKHKIKSGELRRFQCTAEHLVARQDGGEDSAENIVAACSFCNAMRHRRPEPLAADPYKRLVAKRMRQRKWHPKHLHTILGSN